MGLKWTRFIQYTPQLFTWAFSMSMTGKNPKLFLVPRQYRSSSVEMELRSKCGITLYVPSRSFLMTLCFATSTTPYLHITVHWSSGQTWDLSDFNFSFGHLHVVHTRTNISLLYILHFVETAHVEHYCMVFFLY